MFDSEILCFSFDASGGSATILRPEEIDTLVDNPQFLGVEWLNYSDLSLFLPKILMPKFLPPASQLSLFEKLQQGLIGFRDLNDQGSIRETEVIVAELLRRYGYKTRLTRRSEDAGVDVCAVKASPYTPDGYVKSIWQVANYAKAVPVGKVNELPAALMHSESADWMVLVALPRLTRGKLTAGFPVFLAIRQKVIENLNRSLELIEEDKLTQYVKLSPDYIVYNESEEDRQALRSLIESIYPKNLPCSQKIFNYFNDLPL